MFIGDKNSVSLGRNIGDSGLVCQGQTWHIMLGTRVFRWTGVFRAGIVRQERKGEQARDLLRDGVLSEKGRRTPSRRHLDLKRVCQTLTVQL